jgi:thiol-disulfide isomerase/thioredoxin
MLNQKYFGLPLWVWLVVGVIVIYSYKQSCSETHGKSVSESGSKGKSVSESETKGRAQTQPQPQPKPNTKDEKKEKFADTSNAKIKIFNFNTEWCGWSKRFQPEWNKFAAAVKSDSRLNNKVEVFDVKCDNSEKESMCEKYNVPGYPYVIAEINGISNPYNGERTAEDLIKFAKQII